MKTTECVMKTTECVMKTPEIGDVIVTRNGMRWICATCETIREKVGVDLNCGFHEYAIYPIKAYNVDEKSFNVWAGIETCDDDDAIVEVIPAKPVRPEVPQKPRKHSELIKAWADGADIEWFNHRNGVWELIVDPTWWGDEYRIKTTRELVCHINSDGEISSVGSGNLSLTFNLLGELISAEVIKK